MAKMEEERIATLKAVGAVSFSDSIQSTRHCALRAAKSIPRGQNAREGKQRQCM